MAKNPAQIRGCPTASRWVVGALSCLALGLSSFAAPVAERPARPSPAELHLATPEIAVAAPPRGACSPKPNVTVDRNAAVAEAAGYFRAHRSRLTDTEIQQVAEVLVDCAAHYGVEPGLVIAVIHVESRGNAYALSPVGAMGLMQIMPPTGEELAAELGVQWVGAKLLFEPQINVQLGIAYLHQLRQRFGNWATALAAYNWGPAKISRRLRTGVALPVVYSTSVLAAKRTHS
jgi:hypothetical protein